jgi:hypothetical protein
MKKPGAEAGSDCGALRGAEAPLFHGAAGFGVDRLSPQRTQGQGQGTGHPPALSSHNRLNSTRSIAAHPFGKLRAGSCKRREDGALSEEMVYAEIAEGGHSPVALAPPAKAKEA